MFCVARPNVQDDEKYSFHYNIFLIFLAFQRFKKWNKSYLNNRSTRRVQEIEGTLTRNITDNFRFGSPWRNSVKTSGNTISLNHQFLLPNSIHRSSSANMEGFFWGTQTRLSFTYKLFFPFVIVPNSHWFLIQSHLQNARLETSPLQKISRRNFIILV